MYAIHFVLFVTTLVLCHIIQSCLRPYLKQQETAQEADDPVEQQTSAEKGDESCRWAMWSAWSKCTVTCGDGVSVRHRIILIHDNCTDDIVQEKVCSERHCPYDKDFIIQRKDEDFDQSPDNPENQQKSDDVKSEGKTGHDSQHTDAKTPDLDENSDSLGGHMTGCTDIQHGGDYDSDNDIHYDNNGDDAPKGRTRGHSWTSDDGNAWEHQSSFESHGEEGDTCLSDCSPSDPPVKEFGSEGTVKEDEKREAGDSPQDEEQRSFGEDERSGDYTNKKSSEKEGKTKFEEKEKPRNEETVKNDDGKEGKKHDAETDFDDDDNYDDAEDDDGYDDDDGDGDEDNENGSNEEQNQEYDEEEDGEQDDLEQEAEESMGKRRRRKKKRRRKQKTKVKREASEMNSEITCDPTEICDTFMAATENFSSPNGLLSTESGSEIVASTNLMTSPGSSCESDTPMSQSLT